MKLHLQLFKILFFFFLSISINASDLMGQNFCGKRVEAESFDREESDSRIGITGVAGGGRRIKDFKGTRIVGYKNINFPQAGKYNISFRVSMPKDADLFFILRSNSNAHFLSEFRLKGTGGWNRGWRVQTFTISVATSGSYDVYMQAPDFNRGISIDWWQYALQGCGSGGGCNDKVSISSGERRNRQYNFSNTFPGRNLRGIKYIAFDYWSDKDFRNQLGTARLELTSSLTHDKGEYAVRLDNADSFGQSTFGSWRSVFVPFQVGVNTQATNRGQNPNIGNINYFRIYVNGEPNGDYRIKNIRAIIDCGARGRSASRLEFGAHAIQQEVKLEWLTNSGYRVNTFEVEHSKDGENFQPISSLPNEMTNEDMEYHHTTHAQPQQGDNYYRVKEIYFDGTYKYTDVQKVGFVIDLNKINVFPNPASDKVHISMRPYTGQKGNLTLLNQFGQVVKQLDLAEIQTDLLQLNTSELENGLYFLKIAAGNQKAITKKVLINRLY